ncbi:MAG: hydroxymethylbilane synthase [Nocardioides sp.]
MKAPFGRRSCEAVDLAVHSLKDTPHRPGASRRPGRRPPREDPRDVVVARGGPDPRRAARRLGRRTGSPRRAAQLHALGLGLEVRDIQGNVDSRLAKVASRRYDAVVLARAGLARLGRADEVSEILDPLQVCRPRARALAVECRAGDVEIAAQLGALDDPASRACVTAERVVLADLEAGCAAPVGALAEVVEGDDGEELWLRAVALSPDGGLSIRLSASGPVPDAAGVGHRLAALMLDEGAATLMTAPPPRRQHA